MPSIRVHDLARIDLASLTVGSDRTRAAQSMEIARRLEGLTQVHEAPEYREVRPEVGAASRFGVTLREPER